MELKETVVALTAFVVALTALVPVVARLWDRVSRLTRRLDNFWEAHLIRGRAEAYQKNLVVETFAPESPESEEDFMPLAVVKRAFEMYERIRPQLEALREKYPEDNENQLAEKIERRFGRWMGRNICLVLGVSQFACIAMALSIANGIPPASPSDHD